MDSSPLSYQGRLPFTYYSRTLFPIPAVLRGLIIFSSQALLLPFIAYSLLLLAQPQNPIVLEPSPIWGVGRVPDRVLRPAFIPDSAPGELFTSEPQPPVPQPNRGGGKLLASVSCQLLMHFTSAIWGEEEGTVQIGAIGQETWHPFH